MRIEVRGARKRFGKVEALRGVDLRVGSGRRVALVGPNGSGKSTLIRALLGLIECEGSVLLDGLSPWRDRVAVARRIAYVPQVAPALGATVGEIVSLATITRQLSPQAVHEVGDALDLDLRALARRPFRNLSGGMKQKTLLALAFAARPGLLVMDEPTASLDVGARHKFLELCQRLAPDVTLVLCSHRIEEVRHLADHVVEMADGRVVVDAALAPRRPEAALPNPAVMTALALGGVS